MSGIDPTPLRPNLLTNREALLVLGAPMAAARQLAGERLARVAARTFHALLDQFGFEGILKARGAVDAEDRVSAIVSELSDYERLRLPPIMLQISTAAFALRQIASDEAICDAARLWATDDEPWRFLDAYGKAAGLDGPPAKA